MILLLRQRCRSTYAANASFPFFPLPAVPLIFFKAERFSPSNVFNSFLWRASIAKLLRCNCTVGDGRRRRDFVPGSWSSVVCR